MGGKTRSCARLEFVLIIVTSAWWVPYLQVHRNEGGHVVKGKKNFLPPATLVLGYAVLWSTEDEDTMERHVRQLTGQPAAEEPEDETGEGGEQVDEEGSGSDNVAIEASNVHDFPEDKYNLSEYGSASEEAEVDVEPEPGSHQTPTRVYLSAKQRRDLKKGKPLRSHQESDDSEVDEVISSVRAISVSKPKTAPQVRGKKGKFKKIKAKYADQGDDEKRLAQKLLGAKPDILEEPKEKTGPLGLEPTPVKTVVEPSPRPPRRIVEEPLEDLDLSLKMFISAPKPGDVISDAVPMCAPWSALARYKYKVKLMPGTTKKGKAARSAISGFLAAPIDERGEDSEKMSPREKELLGSLKGEIIASIG